MDLDCTLIPSENKMDPIRMICDFNYPHGARDSAIFNGFQYRQQEQEEEQQQQQQEFQGPIDLQASPQVKRINFIL